MYISFAWTTGALLDGEKTQTRRFWADSHARKFHAGDLVNAFDKSPRHGSKKVAVIRLVKEPFRQPLDLMTHKDYLAEGGLRYWKNLEEYKEMMRTQSGKEVPYVIVFEVVKILIKPEKGLFSGQ